MLPKIIFEPLLYTVQNLVMLFYSIQVQNNSFSYVPTLMLLKLSYTLIVFCLPLQQILTPRTSAIFPQKAGKKSQKKGSKNKMPNLWIG